MASDTTIYDPAGNRIHYSARTLLRWDQIAGGDPSLQEAVTLDENTRSYYDAEGRLRATDHRRCVARPVAGPLRCVNWEPAPGRDPGAFEEYRYDALGRRVLVRTRYETGQCGVYLEQCRNKVVRTVWEGDQLLLKLRSTGENNLESDAEWVAYSHGRASTRRWPCACGSTAWAPPRGTSSRCLTGAASTMQACGYASRYEKSRPGYSEMAGRSLLGMRLGSIGYRLPRRAGRVWEPGPTPGRCGRTPRAERQ